jgi:hypothetical protein
MSSQMLCGFLSYVCIRILSIVGHWSGLYFKKEKGKGKGNEIIGFFTMSNSKSHFFVTPIMIWLLKLPVHQNLIVINYKLNINLKAI